jgi:hypothetical protein
LGSFRGQRGAGAALVFAAEALTEALELAVVATAPVTASATTKQRMMVFINEAPFGTALPGGTGEIFLD